jgi:hypothetical protein
MARIKREITAAKPVMRVLCDIIGCYFHTKIADLLGLGIHEPPEFDKIKGVSSRLIENNSS